MFFGEHGCKVDEKGRLALPVKFRREMKQGVILSKGIENCILVYPIAEWKRLSDSLAAKAVTPASLRKLNRAIFGSASNATFDGQGRVILPFALRTHAGINDTAIAVGTNSYVELWNNELWEQEKASDQEQVSELIEGFGAQP